MRISKGRGVGLAVVAVASLGVGFCGGGGGAGTAPTQPAVPVATPTPVATLTPDPPLSASCAKLPAGKAEPDCRSDSPDFQDQVDAAIRTLQAEQPGIFNGSFVQSEGAYYVGLIRILDRQGLCADTEGEELGVARSSGYNEQYDVLTARGEVRFGPSSYRVTCFPSAVPIPKAPLPPTAAGCPLPASRELACGREGDGKYYGDVEAAITQILKEKPQLFDFDQYAPGTDFPLVKDMNGYHQGMVDILKSKGYCATTDGEEIGLKKGSNASSEQYDVNLQDKYVRRGAGIYRVTCYPAAF
jgi:hypothetical protein